MKFWLLLIFVLSICIILPAYSQPSINDNDFVVQKYVTDICCSPTTMDFVDKNDILVLQKTSGNVVLIRNGTQQLEPVLHENVTSIGEQGMLGITNVGNKVYLYFTQSTFNGGPPIGKRIYSYDWNGSVLIHKTLIKNFPQTQNYHNGGAMTTDLNGSVYIVLGDAGQYGKLQNQPIGEPNDTGVIWRVAPTGPYYAMGIRNSFGLTVDPVTGKLWDTENGPDFGDEVNIVSPNFNSGWDVIMGPADKTTLSKPDTTSDLTGWDNITRSNETTLTQLPNYPGYTYHDPQFTWMKTVAPTGIAFVNSPQFEKYKNSVFVGDCNNGNLYKFQLNNDRDGFVFNSPQLADKVVDKNESMDEIIFGTGFGCMSDVVAGPDGLLYIVSLSDGTIYRIVPKTSTTSDLIFDNVMQYLFYFVVLPAIAFAAIYIRKIRKNKTKLNQPS